MNVPGSIAIIMDGNGRWARRQGLMRIRGHEAGVDAVRDVTEACAEWGVGDLTLYAFSWENWQRPQREIKALMHLLRRFLEEERPTLMDNNVRLSAVGRLDRLPDRVLAILRETEELTADNDGLHLHLALSYGGRAEIADAARAIAAKAASGEIDPADVDEETVAAHLYQPSVPDPDLLVRTAGEMRVSNFLLWQVSYTELWVTDLCWPEFRREHLAEAIEEVGTRTRKFGRVVEPQGSGEGR